MNLRRILCFFYGHKTFDDLWGKEKFFCYRCKEEITMMFGYPGTIVKRTKR